MCYKIFHLVGKREPSNDRGSQSALDVILSVAFKTIS